jgi:hypothetical protein
MMETKKNINTDRCNFALSPYLKRSIEIAAHANLITVSEYIRGLVLNDLMANSELSGEPDDTKSHYVVRHELTNNDQ